MFTHNRPKAMPIGRILSDSPGDSTGAKSDVYDCLVAASGFLKPAEGNLNCFKLVSVSIYGQNCIWSILSGPSSH